ncbi:Gfo/Idh/MocA family protein [Halorhabdus rudnickae]|uniref:Gfo/Idh/MocA family protein n=1 Tax=Halorhabdus rudnickae TaxID=1775544 RepID=UPI00108309E0|nr:Gfo/Idh/MocA family oxidoreductase [Halorhabdus rudnickae]
MASETFGIGFVSAGFITSEAHVPSLEYIPDAEVAAIHELDRKRAEDLAEDSRDLGVGNPNIYGEDELAEMVADTDVDAVWVTSPNFTRKDVVEGIVEAVEDGATLQGIAMEKPIARNVDEANRILERVEDAGLPHAYLENWVHEPAIEDMRELLWEQGRDAGRPYIARAQAEHGGPHSAWFWNGKLQGGGALTDMLVHAMGGNDYLLTDPEGSKLEPVAVSADTETLKWSREEYAAQLEEEYGVDYEDSPADDYARVTIRYEDEKGRPVISEAAGSWCYVGSGVSRTVELLGPEYSGQVRTDDDSSSIFLSDELSGEGWAEKQTATSGRMPIDAEVVVNSGYVGENRDAIDAFRDGENGRFDLEDGLRMIELSMAAYRAAEDGEEVDLATADLDGYRPPPARE